jgi:hypothetical protein
VVMVVVKQRKEGKKKEEEREGKTTTVRSKTYNLSRYTVPSASAHFDYTRYDNPTKTFHHLEWELGVQDESNDQVPFSNIYHNHLYIPWSTYIQPLR